MTTYSGGYGVAGSGTIQQSKEYEILWGGDLGKGMVLRKGCVYSSSIADAGNTPTTDIRAGLLVGKVTSSGEMEEWDADASDGTQELAGVVPTGFRAVDQFNNAADREVHMIVKAPLKASQLLIQGTAFTSHVDEFLARRLLHAAGCVLDDDPFGYKAGAGGRMLTVSTGATHAITEAMNGSTIFYTLAGAVAVTLPTIHPGLEYWLMRGANDANDYSISSAEGDNIIFGNDLEGDSITWTTTGEMIGNYLHVKSMYMGTALKWIMTVPPTPLGTGLTGAQAYALAT